MPIDEKIQLHADRGEIVPSRAILKTPAQIEMIRKSADLNTAVLDEVAKHIRLMKLSTVSQRSMEESRHL